MSASSRKRNAERAATAATTRPAPPPPPAATGQRATAIGLRFISCGLLSLCFGLLWKLTFAPHRVGVGSALLGILMLLSGFVVGGLLWYVHDARLRMRDPAAVPDERLVFSFIVFAVMPFAVLVVVGLIWIVALIAGAS